MKCETCAQRVKTGAAVGYLKRQSPETCNWHTPRTIPIWRVK